MALPDKYCVFGHPISHSKSPLIHNLFAQQTEQRLFEYTAKDVPAETFEKAARAFFSANGKGLNCTLPLKELAWKFADGLSERAEIGKAVNTLVIREGKIFGENTDGVGLIRDLTNNLGLRLKAKKILLLGAGGASRGILKPLLDEEPELLVIANRTLSKAEYLKKEFRLCGPIDVAGYDNLPGQCFDIIINATAASLQGQVPPLPDYIIGPSGCCYDLAYSDRPTAFVRWGKQRRVSSSVDGLGMLVEQAAESFAIWRGVHPKTQPVIGRLNSERIL